MPVPDRFVAFWKAFDAAVGGVDDTRFLEAFAFGDSPELADELGALVLAGRKRATASAVWACEARGQPLPAPGQLSIVIDGTGRPLCVIETESVDVVPFAAVDAAFAAAEGEGDGTLAYWRRVHEAYFSRELARIGRAFADTMPVACERFRVVYRAPHGS